MKNFQLSNTQKRLLSSAMACAGTQAYLVSRYSEYDLQDERNLLHALEVATSKSLTLRITQDEEGDYVQYFGDPIKPCVVDTELEGEDLHAYLDELAYSPFEKLLDSPLARLTVVRSREKLYLVLTAHHFVLDGTSDVNQRNNIRQAIEAFRKGEPFSLPDEKPDFEDAVKDEQDYLATPQAAESKEFWIDHLSDIEDYPYLEADELVLPLEYIDVEFTKEESAEFLAFCNSFEKRVSPFSFASAIFSLFLARYYRTPDVVVANAINIRTPEQKATSGMFVNTVPLRYTYDGDKSARQLVAESKETLKKGLINSRYPFNLCVEELGKRGIDAGSLLCYSIVSNSNVHEEEACKKAAMLPSREPMMLPFTVRVNFERNDSEGLQTLRYVYNQKLFTRQQVAYMADSIREMLLDAARNPEKACGDLNMLSEAQRGVLRQFNATEVEYDTSKSITTLFREQAARTPDNTAVVYKDRKLTYRELDEITDSLARHLVDKGIERGGTVAVLIDRSEYMVIASVAAHKAGCAYQPLDPSYPSERLSFMVSDTGAKFLIADEPLVGLVPDYKGEVLLTKDIPGIVDKYRNDHAIALKDPAPEDLFIYLYTSGTTGKPKGCMLEHRNLAAFCHWYVRYYSLTDKDSTAVYASYGFDAHMLDLYPALVTGATVHIIADDIRLDLIALNDYLEKNRIANIFITTQVGRSFALDVENHTLRNLSVGGETLVPLVPPSGYSLHNGYGPTECTIFTTTYRLTDFVDPVPIGKPLDNVKLYVVDARGHRQPIGGVGELLISGAQVGRGYLNRPEENAKAFVENPFAKEEPAGYERVYRTGDVVRIMEDGNVGFIGRKDSQVKIRGFRIELSEVEGIIRQFKGIKDATVVAYDKDDGSGKYIVAYVVSDNPVDVAALGAFIKETKPAYMVPAITMQIDAIPLNQNQKVNRRALPKPEIKVEQDKDEDKRELNHLEKDIHDIIAEVLSCDSFGVNTDLSYVGLTSISALKLVARIYKRFATRLDSRDLVKNGTLLYIENAIIEQAVYASKAEAAAPEKKDEAGKEAGSRTYPLSYSQTGVYYEWMKYPTETVYNISTILKYPAGLVTPEELVEAFKSVIEAHPYLNTRFAMEGDKAVQFEDPQKVDVPVSAMEADEFEKYKAGFVRPFNLNKDVLYRAEIVKVGEVLNLMLDFHHILFDGTSLDLFINELDAAIEGVKPAAESYTYADYVADEIKGESGEEFKQKEAFYDGMLSDCEGASEIHPDLGVNGDDGFFAEVIHETDRAKVEAFCKEQGFTPAALFLASTLYCVARYTGSKKAYISMISSGRGDVRTSDSIGMFVKTLPLAGTIAEQTAADYVKEVSETFDTTIRNEDYPFYRIASKFGYQPNIMYAYQVGVLGAYKVRGEVLETEKMELERAKFKLSVHIEDRDGKLCIVIQYNDALYSKGLMCDFSEAVAQTLDNIIDKPNDPVKHTSMLWKAQLDKLNVFRQTASEDIPIRIYHKGLERQAEINGSKVALIASDATYTYEEFNRTANRMAHSLIGLGVRRCDRVALLLPRTSPAILSMFAVMKCGAAYIPCDPEYPSERIKLILEDSGAAFIITTKERLGEFGDKGVDVSTLFDNPDSTNPDVEVEPTDLAYLIYTSGSTGRPKGVMLEHQGISNYLTCHPENRHIKAMCDDGHIVLSVTTISFDMSLKEIGAPLFNGLTLVFADQEQANNPIRLAELFQKTGADIFNATPSRMLQYMDLPAICDALANCRVILSGGEKYPDTLLKRLQKISSGRIFNTYGPTEITVSSNCKELTHESVISIGKPLLNYREYIVDSDGNELPVGVVGELYIGGIGVARGYNNLPEQTKEHFIEYQGGRVYCSGDYARWMPQGDVETLGRKDNQVKLRGLRIELGEIESAMTHVDGVTAAVALIRTIAGREHIIGYYTHNKDLTSDFIKAEISKTLAPYMVPTVFVELQKMPLTPNGKTDIKSLPTPVAAPGAVGGGEKAQTPTEEQFCQIYAKILGMNEVGATDNFFEMGGTSLTATRIIIEAANLGYVIAYGDVFSKKTPRGLAKLVDAAHAAGGAGNVDPDNIQTYDYSIFKGILENNSIGTFLKGNRQPLGNILLTGATGFLGIHVLRDLLECGSGKICCLMRDKAGFPAEQRLKSMLYYYFENSYEDVMGKRVFVKSGDITDASSMADMEKERIDTVINCAANVKHFSTGTDIEDVNVGGVNNLIDLCLRIGARLVQVSTMSIGGASLNGVPAIGTTLKENMLYFGQFINNKYVHSKFIAERNILEAVAKRGLSAKIMRVGNLSARSTDGEFQINYATNSFMGRLKSYKLIGECPYSRLDSLVEFSPIDQVSKAIVLLAQTPKECTIFHPFNHHFILLEDIFDQMSGMGFNVKPVEDEEFARTLKKAEENPEIDKILSSMLAYENKAAGQITQNIGKNNTYTMQVLYRLGFGWSSASWDYIRKFIQALQGLGYFDLGK
jgi:amino acid adenylation domain-containing protein